MVWGMGRVFMKAWGLSAVKEWPAPSRCARPERTCLDTHGLYD